MQKKNDSPILKKGFYNHSQDFTCMQLKQYIITEKDSNKCLLLRFFNESELNIDGMEIILTQLSSTKEILATSPVKFEGIKVRPGETYTPDEGIVISDKCADFIVTVKSVSSDEYVYSASDGVFCPKYDPKRKKRTVGRGKEKNYAKKRNLISSKLSAILAAILVIGFSALSVGLTVYFYSYISAI